MSEFGGYEGDTRRIWECPSLTPLLVDGNPAKVKWLLMVSSGNQNAETGMQYFIGDFDGKSFSNNYPPDNEMFVDYGSTYYAAIPWNNLPENVRIMIGWLVPTRVETYPWRGQMSIARDMTLKATPEGVYIGHNVNGLMSGTVQTVSVKPVDNKIKLELLFDKSSLEIFANDGEKVITTLVFPDEKATQFSLFAKDGNVKINTLKA